MAAVVIVAEAGVGYGSGHIARMATLAQALSRHHDVHLATPSPQLAQRIMRVLGPTLDISPVSIQKLSGIRPRPDLFVIDRLNTSRSLVDRLRAVGPAVVTFDDHGGGASRANLVVNAIVGRWLSRPTTTGRLLEGPAFLLLSPSFYATKYSLQIKPVRNIVLALGGLSDNAELSELQRRMADVGRRVHVAGGFLSKQAKPLAPILASADLAVTNGGLSMFESLGLGVPTIAIPRTPLEARSVRLAASRGAVTTTRPRELLALVMSLAEDVPRRKELQRRGVTLVDGSGLERVTTAIDGVLNNVSR